MSEIQLTKTQRAVLERLATGKWTLDRHGKDDMQGIMDGPRGEKPVVVAAKTVSSLFREGLIDVRADSVSDFAISKAGLKLIGKEPPPRVSIADLLKRMEES